MEIVQHPRVRLVRRAYKHLSPVDLSLQMEKQTQTDLDWLIPTGKNTTRFVTRRLVLSSDETTDAAFAKAFVELCQRIRSVEWKPSLLVLLGHDPEKRRDVVDHKIRADAASETINNELRVFFETVLAPLIQERETALVNSLHECVHQELQTQHQVIQSQHQRVTQLTQQLEEWEKHVTHLKGKVDRRVAENNALRKEQYRQLLMLRDLMNKQGTESGALSGLNEAIATVLAGKQAPKTTQSNNEHEQLKYKAGRGGTTLNVNTQGLHREKEKWEQRARESTVECQELREKITRLMQENVTYRASESTPWFLTPKDASVERQRIADAVCSYQGNWEDIGDALVELLNSDILWAAVEQSARRGGKRRIARGLEAVVAQIDSYVQSSSSEVNAVSEKDEDPAVFPCSTLEELGRLIPCKGCNGVGYIHADESTNDSDLYLRKTLEQVLELKTQLEKASTKSLTLEGQLELSCMHVAQLQEKILQAELVKSSAVDSCLQTDLDEEDGLDLDEIMRSAYGQEHSTGSRQNRRNTLYEHLIVELKNTLADKDEGLAENRRALDVAQARAGSLQRAFQKEKETHARELVRLKTSLAFSLQTRNSKIEERQAAVKLLMIKFAKKSPPQPPLEQRSVVFLPSMDESKLGNEGDSDDDTGVNDTAELVEIKASELGNNHSEVKRMEALVQRYTEDIIRVRKEHEIQQELLKKTEVELAEEDAKRNRTNNLSQGNLVVSLASHPRDLFKALSTAQTDMLKLRRASQRSSALQTDRLLTLTTHLSHMSEEMCTLRKQNVAELEFWQLECDKLQNMNKALEMERQIAQKQLEEAHERGGLGDASGSCAMCEKHKKRLTQISNELLNQTRAAQADPEVDVPAPTTLTAAERQVVSKALLELETIYSGMPTVKQQLARELIATHLGNSLSPRSSRRTTIDLTRSTSKMMRMNQQNGKEGGSTVSLRSAGSSPRKVVTPVKTFKSSCQVKTTEDVLDSRLKVIESPTQATDDIGDSDPTCTSQDKTAGTSHRKTLVQEIFESGWLTKHGLAIDEPVPTVLEMESSLENRSEFTLRDANTDTTANNSDMCNKIFNENEPRNVPVLEDDTGLELEGEEFPLMKYTSDIEHDPEVILQLRRLINESAGAKTRLAAVKWQMLVCRILCITAEHRLDQGKLLADKRATIHSDGSFRPVRLNIISMCNAMIRIIQQRKSALATAVSAHEVSRRELKKAQAQLIRGVAMLLDNLSRKGRPKIELNELLYPSQGGSPRRSPTSNRPLYPATKIHLNHLPRTQQIPTSTFPALVDPHSNELIRASSSKHSGEQTTEISTYSEGYHLPHRLIKSAGPRPFNLIHSSIGTLQGSMPFPDPVHIRNFHESEGRIVTNSVSGLQRPVRPHSSPAGPRLMSPRAHDLVSSASLLRTPIQIAESVAATEANSTSS